MHPLGRGEGPASFAARPPLVSPARLLSLPGRAAPRGAILGGPHGVNPPDRECRTGPKDFGKNFVEACPCRPPLLVGDLVWSIFPGGVESTGSTSRDLRERQRACGRAGPP